jgi:hypothetical protein
MNRFDIEVLITEFINGEPQFDEDSLSLRLVCKTSKGEKIVFWGSPEEGTRNINSLKNQKLPVLVECEAYEPSEKAKRKYGTTYSIPEHSRITINPEI